MRIAYYEENDYHTEILGTFLEYCCLKGYKMDFFNNKDQSYFINHYESKFKVKIDKFPNEELLAKFEIYDYVIVGTMGATSLLSPLMESEEKRKKFIQVYHNADDLKASTKLKPSELTRYITEMLSLTKCVVLTPLNRTVGSYLLPIFDNCNNAIRAKSKIIAMVGRFTQHRHYDALLPLLSVSDYTLWIIARRVKFVPPELVELSKRNPKIRISYKLDAQKMSDVLKRAKFLLCAAEPDSWYYKDRLTGTIPLSFNYEVPMLIPKNLNAIYKIQGAVEYESVTEIPTLVSKIENSEGSYEKIVKMLVEQKKSIVKENREILENLLH
jgi:hypothetical protein